MRLRIKLCLFSRLEETNKHANIERNGQEKGVERCVNSLVITHRGYVDGKKQAVENRQTYM